jgi:tetratricopeptide (TPR) repeat protein
MKNTRVEVLDILTEWCTSTCTPQFIFWLSGMAGTGKSAIMKTLCDRLVDLGILGACFFVSRTASERRNPQNIIRSLAYQLARFLPQFRETLCQSLREDPDIVEQSMTNLVKNLLEHPLFSSLNFLNRVVVLVIDGLDECDKDRDGLEGGNLLSALSAMMHNICPNVKIVITSRPETSIEQAFSAIDSCSFRLHQIESAKVRRDIQFYLETCLREIAEQRQIPNGDTWPSHSDKMALLDRSGGLFIYATTIIKYIGNPRFSPIQRLKSILSCNSQVKGSLVYGDLHTLYIQILKAALGPDLEDQEILKERIHQALGVLLALCAPLSIQEMAKLLIVTENELRRDLEALSSVVLVPEKGSNDLIQIFHASFADFLLSTVHCPPTFRIALEEFHGRLAVRCIQLQMDHVIAGAEDHTSSTTDDSHLTVHSYASKYHRYHVDLSSGKLLESAIGLRRCMLHICGLDHPLRGRYVYELAFIVFHRYKKTGEISSLEEAIDLNRQLLELPSPGYLPRGHCLAALGHGLHTLFLRKGERNLLSDAVSYLREAAELWPPGHASRGYTLIHLGSALKDQFEQTGDISALSESVDFLREALELRPPGHPYRNFALVNLAVSMQALYRLTGSTNLIDEAIYYHREALELRPPGHPFRASSLNHLACALRSRAENDGRDNLLHEAVHFHREGLELRPPGTVGRDILLDELGYTLFITYEKTFDANFLDEAICLYREALELFPLGSVHRSVVLDHLATALRELSRLRRSTNTMEEAIRLHQEAIQALGGEHPNRKNYENNLAITYRMGNGAKEQK